MRPVLLVIAGPNGAGKTTVTVRLRHDRWSEGVEYLNPDDIARDRFGDWNSPEAVLNAARWADARREELLASGAGIAFETVLSTKAKLDFIARAKDQGYFARSMANLSVAIRLADRAYVYDNSVEDVEARLCFRTQDAFLRKVYCELPEWVADAAQGLATHPQFVDMRVA